VVILNNDHEGLWDLCFAQFMKLLSVILYNISC